MKCPWRNPSGPAFDRHPRFGSHHKRRPPFGTPLSPDEQASSEETPSFEERPSWERRPHFGKRPPWWPESETWPPVPRHARHVPPWRFLRRVGCLFLFISLLLAFFFSLAGLFVAHQLGWVQVAGQPAGQVDGHTIPVLPLIGLLVLAGMGFLGMAGRRLYRVSAPLGDLMAASEQVATGDYSTRVKEQGPVEVRRLSLAFNQMADHLQTSDEQRRRMLADISHELRTPLTIIQGNLEGMLDGVYPADEAHLKSIFEESQVLGRLVEDLHLLALAESSALQLQRQPTDLAVLINETMAAFQARAEAAGVHLAAELPEQAPPLSLDSLRLHEVLSNLIANALRYTPAGGEIRLRYTLTGQGESPLAHIEVSDTGPGIAAADLPYVFERFYKARDSGGSGLGLAIARRLVEAHGGTIEASNPAEGGTTIRITLPG